MATHSHFMIDALRYLAKGEQWPETAADEQQLQAAGARRAVGNHSPERHQRAHRHPTLWIAAALLVAAALTVPVAAGDGADGWLLTAVLGGGVVLAVIVTHRTRTGPAAHPSTGAMRRRGAA